MEIMLYRIENCEACKGDVLKQVDEGHNVIRCTICDMNLQGERK